MKRYDWQPGNGSRYDLIYGKVGDTHLITWMRFGAGSGVTSAVPDYMHYTYLVEKMNINIADATAILQFLEDRGRAVGYPLEQPTEMPKLGDFIGE